MPRLTYVSTFSGGSADQRTNGLTGQRNSGPADQLTICRPRTAHRAQHKFSQQSFSWSSVGELTKGLRQGVGWGLDQANRQQLANAHGGGCSLPHPCACCCSLVAPASPTETPTPTSASSALLCLWRVHMGLKVYQASYRRAVRLITVAGARDRVWYHSEIARHKTHLIMQFINLAGLLLSTYLTIRL